MNILMVLNLNAKMINSKHMIKLLDLKLFDRLKEISKIYSD